MGGVQEKQLFEDRAAAALSRLREMDLFRKEDIRGNDLLVECCRQDCFSEKVFRFLVDWDPDALGAKVLPCDKLPLHWAARGTIRAFQVAFEAGIRYFPKMKGVNFLFQEYYNVHAPFKDACKTFGRKETMKVIEDTLINCSNEPLNTVDAFLLAVMDENISLDGVNFL